MPEANNMELVREYAATGSEEVFAELVRRHINLAYSVALRFTRDYSEAEDITQAVFIIFAQKAGSLRSGTVLTGWIYETTRWTALRFLRTKARRHRHEQEARMQIIPEKENPDANWQQLAPLLEAAMSRLNEKDRTLLALRYFENRSAAESAALLGIGEWAARKRADRALEKLRNYFSKRGVHSTTALIAGALSANSIQVAPAALATSVTTIAAAKGATASVSTLTLAKGALKIMAWTKTKTTIATTAAILLLSATGVLVTYHWFGSSTGTKLPTGHVKPMIAYGYSRYIVALASDGSLWSWGEERLGWPVLGYAGIQNTTSARRIGHDSDWMSVAVGGSECLAIKSDGSLWAWGGNLYYQLGDGTKTDRPAPVRSIPGNDWKQAAAGMTSFAIKNDGTLWAWGNGYLGNGQYETSAKAVQVGTSANWAKVSANGIHVVGLQSDGPLRFWRSLTGDGRHKNAFLVPTQISPDTNWVDACFGYFTVLAIKSDGTLWSFGNEANFYTQAPDTSSNGIPMQVGTDSDWASCSSAPGCLYCLLRKTDGSLWALDASEHRIVKPAASYAPLKTEKIDWNSDIAAYAAGGDNIGIILSSNGEVWTWGRAIGEFSQKDYLGQKNGKYGEPKPTIVQKPWRLSIASAR